MKTTNSERKIGKVKWFNNAKGYGFILAEGSTEDLFAHYSTIQMQGYRTLKAGQAVQFEIEPSEKGSHAINIVCLEENKLVKATDDPCQPSVVSTREETTSDELEPSI